jgi:hypothetical protein
MGVVDWSVFDDPRDVDGLYLWGPESLWPFAAWCVMPLCSILLGIQQISPRVDDVFPAMEM